jgi:hypothetical protein
MKTSASETKSGIAKLLLTIAFNLQPRTRIPQNTSYKPALEMA